MPRMSEPRVCTIPASEPFLDTLARAVLDGALPVAGGAPPDRLELSRWTILLPTRRAARALGEAFLRVSGDKALLLPRIRPLGDVEEEPHGRQGKDGGEAHERPDGPGAPGRERQDLRPPCRRVERRGRLAWRPSSPTGNPS